ncbi:hypothetical protein [Streptomyces sp. NPDC102283]|uniref:hypothetical protein n=1 Tax=Streptomyces sp. NPDC102283 TaxID=3366155 RepID=UPI00380B3443
MTVDTTGNPSGQRRERQTGHRRKHRFYVSFDDAELEVVRTAAGREQMAPAAWAGRQLMAVAQHTLIPVSADTGDVLRELIRSRAHLQETLTALRALTTPTAPFPVDLGTPADRPCAALPNAAAPVLPEKVRVVVEAALSAVRRVDEATVQVMRERRPRS